jgi:hypothetical protein
MALPVKAPCALEAMAAETAIAFNGCKSPIAMPAELGHNLFFNSLSISKWLHILN